MVTAGRLRFEEGAYTARCAKDTGFECISAFEKFYKHSVLRIIAFAIWRIVFFKLFGRAQLFAKCIEAAVEFALADGSTVLGLFQ